MDNKQDEPVKCPPSGESRHGTCRVVWLQTKKATFKQLLTNGAEFRILEFSSGLTLICV